MNFQIISSGQINDLSKAIERIKELAERTSDWEKMVGSAKSGIDSNLKNIAAAFKAVSIDTDNAVKNTEAWTKVIDSKIIKDHVTTMTKLSTALATLANQEQLLANQLKLTREGHRDSVLVMQSQLSTEEKLRKFEIDRAGQLAILTQRLEAVADTTSRQIARSRELLKQHNDAYVADLRRAATSEKLVATLQHLMTVEGQADSQNRAKIATQEKINSLEERAAGDKKLAIAESRKGIQQTKAETQNIKEQNKLVMDKSLLWSRAYRNTQLNIEMMKLLASETGRQNIVIKTQVSQEQQLIANKIRRSYLERELGNQLAWVTSEEGKRALVQAENVKHGKYMQTVDAQRANTIQKLTEQTNFYSTAAGKKAAETELESKQSAKVAGQDKAREIVLRNLASAMQYLLTHEGQRAAIQQAEIQNTAKLITLTTNLTHQINALRATRQGSNAVLTETLNKEKALEAGRKQAETFSIRQENRMNEQLRVRRQLSIQEGKDLVKLQNSNSWRQKQLVLADNITYALQQQQEKTRLLGLSEAQKLEISKVLHQTEVKLITLLTRKEGALALARRANQADIVDAEQKIISEKAITSARHESQKAAIQQAEAERKLAREKAKLADPRYIQFLKDKVEARAAKEAAIEEANRTVVLQKLRRELAYVNSAQGRMEIALRQQISAQRQSAEEARKQTASFKLLSQATASLRAGLAGLKMSFGMYTSSTILVATAMFTLTASLRRGFEAGKDFTFQMSQTKAVMNSLGTDTSFARLEQEVVKLGKSTQFTMTEVARASTELGKIGLSAEEATAALKPVLQLSLMGDMDLADAAKTATDVMLLFKKEASELGNVVDVMATAVTNSSATINQLTNALSYAGASAEAAGFQLEEVVAAEMALANAGIRGSIAGTALRRAFTNLLSPTVKGAKALKEFGVVTADAFGGTRDFKDILRELASNINNLPEKEKIEYLTDIFGVRAASSMAALLGNVEGYNKALDQLMNSEGSAHQMMKARTDNLHTDMKMLYSALEAMYVDVFRNSEDQLRIWVLKAKGWIDHLSEDIGNGVTRIEAIAATTIKTLKLVGIGIMALKGAKVIGGFLAARREANNFNITITNAAGQQQVLQFQLSATNRLLQQQAGLLAAGASMLPVAGSVRRGQGPIVPAQVQRAQAQRQQVPPQAGGKFAGAKAFLGLTGTAGLSVPGIGTAITIAASLGYLGVIAYEAYDSYQQIANKSRQNIDDFRAKQKALLTQMRPDEDAEAKKAEVKASREAHFTTTSYLTGLKQDEAELRKNVESVKEQLLDADDASKGFFEHLLSTYESRLKAVARTIFDVEQDFNKKSNLGIGSSQASRDTVSRDFYAALYSDLAGPRAAAEEVLKYNSDLKAIDDKVTADIAALTEEHAKIPEEIAKYRKAIWDHESLIGKRGLRSQAETRRTAEKTGAKILDDATLAYYEKEIELLQQRQEVGIEVDKQRIREQANRTLSYESGLYYSPVPEVDEEQVRTWRDLMNTIKEVRGDELDEVRAKAQAEQLGVLEKYTQSVAEIAKLEAEYVEIKDQLYVLTDKGQNLLVDGEYARDEHKRLSGQMVELTRQINEEEKKRIPLEEELIHLGVTQSRTLAARIRAEEKLRAKQNTTLKGLSMAYAANRIAADEYALSVLKVNEEIIESSETHNKHAQIAEQLREIYGSMPSYLSEYATAIQAVNKAEAEGVINAEKAAELRERSRDTMAQSMNTPKAQANLQGGMFSSAFQPHIDKAYGMKGFADAQSAVDNSWEAAEDQEAERWSNQQRAFTDSRNTIEFGVGSEEQKALALAELREEQIKATEQHLAREKALYETHKVGLEELQGQQVAYAKQTQLLAIAGMLDTSAQAVGMLQGLYEEGSRQWKAAMLTQKALAIASILINTYVAAWQAKAALGVGAGDTAYGMILATGYANAAFVGGMAIQQASQSKDRTQGSDAKMYDNGGTISRGKWGIVGEYGPEIVNGPARITSRKNTAHQLKSGGDTYAPAINVNYTSEGSSETSEADARGMANMIKSIVIQTMQDQMRSNGMLSRR